MKCLTVKQPWAHAIMHLGKEVENRTWNTNYRGPLAIHAGMAISRNGMEELQLDGFDMSVEMPRGVIIGVVDLVDVIGDADKWTWWADKGQVHWVLENPRPLVHPIPYRGQLGLFTLDGATAVKVNSQIRARQRR